MSLFAENGYSVTYRLSNKEKKAAVSGIKVHVIEEKVKGYLPVRILEGLLALCLGVGVLITLIVIAETWKVLDQKLIIYIWLAIVCMALGIHAIKDRVIKFYLDKNEPAEQHDEPKMETITLLERGLLQVQQGYEFLALWREVIQVHEQDGFIYIRRKDNRFMVIPARVFPDQATKQDFLEKLKSYVLTSNCNTLLESV